MLPDYSIRQASFSGAFAPALTDPERAIPADVVGPRGKGAVKRYNVYRNNVTVSLIDALAAIYPAVQRITGVEFFRAMARFHVRATPPASPLLFEYGRDFPAFIECYEFAQDMPWLADVARIERAWLDAYHAADAETVLPEALAAVPPDRLGALVFTPHPATRILRSVYPAVAIFAMNRTEGPVTPLRSANAEDALKIIDMMLSPDYQKVLAETDFMVPANTKTVLDPAFAESFPVTPEISAKARTVSWSEYNLQRVQLSERWQREIQS